MNSSGSSTPFDYVVLTAANPAQAGGYEAQIRWRIDEGRLNPATRFLVVPDPQGRRVGSAGATLNALAILARRLCRDAAARECRQTSDLFRGRRILICHSGGDSRRVPAYAAHGKIFTPLPAAVDHKWPATMFDLILANAQKLPAPEAGQVIIMVGDVLLTIDETALDFSAPGIIGVAYPGPLDRGARHGVYVVDGHVTAGRVIPVRDFLQKPDAGAAHARRAVDSSGRVLIDTGILNMDPPTVGRLLTMAGVRFSCGRIILNQGLLSDMALGVCAPMDLYEELTMALVPRISQAQYLKSQAYRSAGTLHSRRLLHIYRAMHRTRFSVNILPYCEFFHIGTSRELLANMSLLTKTAHLYGFSNYESAFAAEGINLEGAFVINSIIESVRAKTGLGVFIEGSHCDVNLALEGDNVLVGLPAGAGVPIRLRRGVGLVCLPVGRSGPARTDSQGGRGCASSAASGWIAVVFGMDDDFKSPRGKEGCRFLNIPIETWLERRRIAPRTIWPKNTPENLWEARLWRVGALPDVLRQALWLQSQARHPHAAAQWCKGRRLSMAQILPIVNHERLIALRRDIQRQVGLRCLQQRIMADNCLPVAEVVGQIHSATESAAAFDQVMAAGAANPAALVKARALEIARGITAKYQLPRNVLKRHGFANNAAIGPAVLEQVADSLDKNIELPGRPGPSAILHDQVVWVTTPVRLDFAGGWSDTPPFCIEQGGTVLNAAITLNGQYPVQVMAKLNSEMCVRLSSIDLGLRREIRTTDDALDHSDPHDWTALPKAALVLAGIAPRDRSSSLRGWLERLGGGIDLTIFSAVPKGSGLGTSSILGAAVLACLLRIRGQAGSSERLIALTSVLEQWMKTGGGWQDQVGGIVPGVKLIRTQPGMDQTPALQWTVFNMDAGGPFHGRLLLYFTGQKRMARDILHNVVHRYLARDPHTLLTIGEIKELPFKMKADLDAQDVDGFARALDRYWTLKKQLDDGATNAKVESVLRRVAKWTSGRCLAGAGGGGFILFVARDPAAAVAIRRELESHPPGPHARFFDFAVDRKGLDITVL
jgi:fucokinase